MNPLTGLKYAAIQWRDTLESYNYHTFLYEALGGKYHVLPASIGQEQFSTSFGYGSFSAGHLDLTKGAKSFGTLGQDDTPQLESYYSDVQKHGISYMENDVPYSKSYQWFTFLADADQTGSETAQAKVDDRELE